MAKTVLIAAPLLVWLTVAIVIGVVVSGHTSSTEPPNTGPITVKTFVDVRPDGTCLVGFPVDDKVRRDLAAKCPNGVEHW